MILFCLPVFSDTFGRVWFMFQASSHNHKSCFKQRSQNHLSLCSSTFPVAGCLKPEQHYDSQHKPLMLLATPLMLFISPPCCPLHWAEHQVQANLALRVAKRSSHHTVLIVINGNRAWVGCFNTSIFPSRIIKKKDAALVLVCVYAVAILSWQIYL